MIRRFSPRIIPGIFIAYVLVSFGLLGLLNFDLPGGVEKIISIIIFPFFYLFYPFYPVLKKLGMLNGEFWQMPSLIRIYFCCCDICNCFLLSGLSRLPVHSREPVCA